MNEMQSSGDQAFQVVDQPGEAELATLAIPGEGQDATIILRSDRGQVAAHCSLWWSRVPGTAPPVSGLLGHYHATTESAAKEVLERACLRLHAARCNWAIGPMDGTTWRRYRFVTDAGSEPPFFLEPQNPPDYPRQWLRAGFQPSAQYFSAMVTDLDRRDARVPGVMRRLREAGVTLRAIDVASYEAELRRLYELSRAAFRDNHLYADVAEGDFLRIYLPLRPLLVPELAILAERGDRLVGFSLAIPDLLQAQRGGKVDTVVLKTVAIGPGRPLAGLGAVLVNETSRRARELGYARVIHALMHEQNNSLNLSARYGKPFRRYTLFAKPL